MQIKKDKFVLGQSESKTIGSIGEEIRLDLKLEQKSNVIGAIVKGTVRNTSGQPITNALIKIMDSNFEPLLHAITDEQGEYLFNNIPSSSAYTIFAIADGKKLKQDQQFALSNGESKTIDFVLEDDPAMQLGIIAGDLYQNGTTTPINGAVVSLYKIVNGEEILSALTNTNEYGQFVFREVENGPYEIKISALGFVSDSIAVEMLATSKIMLIKPTLVVDPNAENGTVSGLITNDNNTPINRADVILYKVENNELTPIAFTKTNTSGVYLFINVPQGVYKVKSNEMEIVEVEIEPPLEKAPNVASLSLSQATTLNPIVTEAQFGVLSNGAAINQTISPGFVDFIGGEDDGTVMLSVDVALAGKYSISLQHLNTNERNLVLDINGSIGENLLVPATSSFNPNDSKIFTTEIALMQGNNIIKLKGDGANFAPVIKEISFMIKPFEQAIDVNTGTLSGGASVNQTIALGFVDFIGGEDNGSVTLSLDIALEGEYSINLSHLNTTERNLKVDINNLQTVTYAVPPTASFNSEDAEIFTFTANLVKGINTIRLHNDNESAFAPVLGSLTYIQQQFSQIIEAENATLGGSATLSGDFVLNLGGTGNGYIEINNTLPFTGVYNLAIKYVTITNDTKAKVLINGVATGVTYSFEKTDSLDIADAKVKVIKLTLNSGENKIKFN